MDVYTRSIGSTLIPTEPYVLLVDDEAESVQPLGELVRHAGHAAVITRSAVDALACCFHRRPSLLVTDLDMPGKDGRDLARWFKRRHPTVPILLVTGQDLENPRWRVPCEHFEAIYAKPLDFERFIQTIAQLMPPPRRRGSLTGRP